MASELNWFQGPQILLKKDRFRVYFSTRITENNYFYSDIAYADFDLSFNKIIETSKKQIITRGVYGAFDEDGIFPFHVYIDRNSKENRLFGFICGWKRKYSVSIDMSIGISESKDNGKTFTRLGDGPILTANLNEPYLVGDPYIIFDETSDTHTMFYIAGVGWKKNSLGIYERKYSIFRATSKDLINWSREGAPIIKERLQDEAQAMPCVLKINDKFHMFYCYRPVLDFRSPEKIGQGYRIGHAVSDSLNGSWILSDFSLKKNLKDPWDHEMECYPNAVIYKDVVYLVYNGNKFGKDGFGLCEIPKEELLEHARL